MSLRPHRLGVAPSGAVHAYRLGDTINPAAYCGYRSKREAPYFAHTGALDCLRCLAALRSKS